MLIRSSPARLERLRVPIGPLRVNWDHPLAANLRGLWVWSAQNVCLDISRQNPDLTFTGAPTLDTFADGDAINSSASGTSGARFLFNTGSALSSSLGGLTTFCRVASTSTAQSDNGLVFGVVRAGASNPFHISSFGRSNVAGECKFWWNSNGTFASGTGTNVFSTEVPRSLVLSHDFGVAVRGYTAGTQSIENTSSMLAPTFAGSNDILAFGYDTVNDRNSAVKISIAGVFGHAWSAQDAALAEADPYGLVEQERSFLSMMPAGAPPTAPGIAVTGNGNAITDGDATPSATDHTDFGSIIEGGATVSRTFTVANPGDATLNISSVTVPTGFTKTTDLPATIAAAANAGLIVRLDNSVVGVKSGDITIAHDAVGSPFNFAITGEVTAAPPPPPPPPPSSGIPQAPASGVTFAPAGLLIR